VFKPLVRYLDSTGDAYKIMVITDHYTPVKIRTHTAEPVPFVLYNSENKRPAQTWKAFSEASGEKGLFFNCGCDLADYFFSNQEPV